MQDFKSVVEWGVIGLLLSLSAWAVAVALERWRFYRQVQVQSYRSRVRLETELTQRLGVIGSVAANAPQWLVPEAADNLKRKSAPVSSATVVVQVEPDVLVMVPAEVAPSPLNEPINWMAVGLGADTTGRRSNVAVCS